MEKKDPEIAGERDRFYNYCFKPYEPAAANLVRYKSSNLLFKTFELSEHPEALAGLVGMIRSNIGSDRSVWGVKLVEGVLSWEFYYYNYDLERKIRIPDLMLVIEPFLDCRVKVDDQLSYFMFSFEITERNLDGRELSELSLYFYDTNDVQNGLSYSVANSQIRLRNYYHFFPGTGQKANMLGKLKQSVFVNPAEIGSETILIPQLVDCASICLANKQECDGVYFSGLDLKQFLFFLGRFCYPESIISYVEDNLDKLEHIKYDVGFDYRMAEGKFHVSKSGFYGTF